MIDMLIADLPQQWAWWGWYLTCWLLTTVREVLLTSPASIRSRRPTCSQSESSADLGLYAFKRINQLGNSSQVHKTQRFFSYIVGLELKSVLPILQNWVLVSEPPLQFLICSAYITLKEQKTQILHWSLQSEITRRRSIMINLLLLCVKSWSTLIVPCAKFSFLLWLPTASIPSELAVHQNI